MRRHGWQRPLHPLQFIGISVFVFLVTAFYIFLGPFLGNKIVENTIISLYSFTVLSVIILYIRCTAIDPSDKTNSKKRRKKKRGESKAGVLNKKYIFILWHIIVRFIRKVENKILRCCLRRKYLNPWHADIHLEPLLPFPLVLMDDAVSPNRNDAHQITFCELCDFEVKLNSKHCRSCDRCVEGFDHHCRWLNNCVGKRNYTTFILLMVFVLLMLVIEGGAAFAVFVRCFADSKGIARETKEKLHAEFPKGIVATISIFLAILATYTTAALGQLFFFHVVLIRKGMRTYDYILAMREQSQVDDFSDHSDSSSDESIDLNSPERPTFFSQLFCRSHEPNQSTRRLSIRIEKVSHPTTPNKKPEYNIDPWKLIKMSKEKALMAAEKAREKIRQKPQSTSISGPLSSPLKPLPQEMKQGPLTAIDKKMVIGDIAPVVPRGWFPNSPNGLFSSPRRRVSFSGTSLSTTQKYRSNFDMRLTEVSGELETCISKQVLCSVAQVEDKVEDST